MEFKKKDIFLNIYICRQKAFPKALTVDKSSHVLAFLSESLIQIDTSSKMLIISINLLTQFIDELIKTQIHFSFYFVIEKLFLKYGQSIVSTIVIQIKRIQYTSS